LVLGVYEGKDLEHIGEVGTGFDERSLRDIADRLAPLVQEACPFKKKPSRLSPARWVRPDLAYEVQFTAWTSAGHLRHPVFLGMADIPAKSNGRRPYSRHAVDAVE
jgi:bifunctional non-homologous end joining protein LigD